MHGMKQYFKNCETKVLLNHINTYCTWVEKFTELIYERTQQKGKKSFAENDMSDMSAKSWITNHFFA